MEVPLRCTGIAVVLLKKFDNEYKGLLLKRATPVLRDVWCYIGGSIEEGENAWQSALRDDMYFFVTPIISSYYANCFDCYIIDLERYPIESVYH